MDMPMKKKRTATAQAAARGPLPELPAELMDHLVKGPMTPSEVQDLILALRNMLTKSVRATVDWKAAMNQFAILFGDRFTATRG